MDAAVVPSISWSLRLHPPALEKAYWQERSTALMCYDWAVVTRFNLLGLCALTISLAPQMPYTTYTSSMWSLWMVYLMWACLMLFSPMLYKKHRLWFVAAISFLVMFATERSMGGMCHLMGRVAVYTAAPKTTLLVKCLTPSNAAHYIIETIGHPMPYALSMLTMWVKAWTVVLGRYMQVLVAFSNTAVYSAAAQSIDNWWQLLLSSPMTLNVPKQSSIEGRATAMLLFITLMCITPAAISTYTAYVNQLLSMRVWLRAKAHTAASEGSCVIQGQRVLLEQLSALHDQPLAVVLLDPFVADGHGMMTSKAVALCLHAVLLGALCQLVLMFSCLFVYQLFPRVLCLGWLQQYLDLYYPLQAY